jgi:hypothetical protein
MVVRGIGYLKEVLYIKEKKMAKRLSRQEKIDQSIVDLINEMFKIAGHEITYDDIKDRKDNWFSEYTMTEEQNEEWVKWGKKYFQKKLNMYARQAEKEMIWVNLMWGLRIHPSPFTKIKQNEQTESN